MVDLDKSELTAEVLRLTILCQQGGATEDEAARLDVLLADSQIARDAYIAAAADTITLVGASEAMASKEGSSAEALEKTEGHRLGRPGVDESIISDWSITSVRKLFAFAIASCLLLSAGWTLSWWSTGADSTSMSTAARPITGWVVPSASIEWSEGAPQYRAWSRVSIGEDIRFESGMLELILDNGARVVLEGPADFSLVSSQKAVAKKGKLVVHCGPDAVGFEVESPDANIVDLGTMFGLSIVEGTHTDVIVYEGAVDLSVRASTPKKERRLTAGEGLHIGRNGETGRIASVHSNSFLPPPDPTRRGGGRSELIESVSDSLQSGQTSKYYRIIGGGFAEDCPAYVDRLHEWNGLDSQGIPSFLRGGDYIMTFNDDKRHSFNIAMKLAEPVRVYVLMDDRVPVPQWLSSDFIDTGWDVGLDSHIVSADNSKYKETQRTAGVGPGKSIDRVFSVWHRDVPDSMVLELGSLRTEDLGDVDPYTVLQSMYGIVVTRLPSRLDGYEKDSIEISPPQKAGD